MTLRSPLSRSRRSLVEAPDEETNFVPLIDVLFGVLAALMFCLTLARHFGQFDLRLPAAGNSGSIPTQKIEVSFDKEGRVRLNGHAVAIKSLSPALKLVLRDKKLPIVLQGDRRAPFGVSAKILKAISEAGAGSLLVQTRESDDRR